MQRIIFCCAMLTLAVAAHGSTSKEYETFASKYESIFKEKPSNKIWSLGKGQQGASCGNSCQNCQSGCKH